MDETSISTFEIPSNCRNRPPPRCIDITGQRYSRLVATGFSHRSGNRTFWWFRCDCSAFKVVCSGDVRREHIKSCGCLAKEQVAALAESAVRHGLMKRGKKRRIVSIWENMIARCHRIGASGYSYYGSRGISVCEEWRSNVAIFHDWAMLNGYRDDLFLDRRNNDGNYEPDNCRWVSRLLNMNNTRANRFLTYNGETRTMAEWARLSGIHYRTFCNRVSEGWSGEELFRPTMSRGQRIKERATARRIAAKRIAGVIEMRPKDKPTP